MLIVTRRVDEEIIIGRGNENMSEIKISLLQIRGNQCRVGITADRDVSVHRGEVQDRIDNEGIK